MKRRINMVRFRRVEKNGKKRTVPIGGKRRVIERKASYSDVMRYPPEKIGRIIRAAGFENSDYDPFGFHGKSGEFSVNGLRLSKVDGIYLGEEAASFFEGEKNVATVFYTDMDRFSAGGKARTGADEK